MKTVSHRHWKYNFFYLISEHHFYTALKIWGPRFCLFFNAPIQQHIKTDASGPDVKHVPKGFAA